MVDADGCLIAGNGVYEQAQALNIPTRVIETDGNEHKCCLCKAEGGFFGVEKCIVPCVMYQSNKRGEMVWNKYGFGI